MDDEKLKAGELSDNFKKSRNKLIYFSGLGIILCNFPLSKESSLFGLKFEGLSGDKALCIFLSITFICFFDFIFKWIEEWPVLKGDYSSGFLRSIYAQKRYNETLNGYSHWPSSVFSEIRHLLEIEDLKEKSTIEEISRNNNLQRPSSDHIRDLRFFTREA